MPFRTVFASVIRCSTRFVIRAATDRRTPVFGHGLLCACFALICIQQVISFLGTTPPVSIAMTAAVAVGLMLAMQRRHDANLADEPSAFGNPRPTGAVLLVGLALWTIIHPLLLDGIAWFAATSRWNLESNLTAIPFVVIAVLLSLSPPAWALTRLTRCLHDEIASRSHQPASAGEHSTKATTSFLMGFGLGVMACGLWLAPEIGLDHTTLTCAGVAAVWATLRAMRTGRVATDDDPASDGNAIRDRSMELQGVPLPPAEVAIGAAISVASGGFLAVWMRMAHQLVPQTSLALTGEIGALAIGVAAGLGLAAWLLQRQNTDAAILRLRLAAGLATWSFVVVAVFPLLARGALWLNAFVSQPSLLSLGRFGLTAFMLAPAGFVFGLAVAATSGPRRRNNSWLTTIALLSFWLTATVAVPASNPVTTSMCHAAGLLGVVALCWKLIAIASPSRLGRLGWALSALLLPSSLLWIDNYSPAATARTLFSTNVFIARRGKLESEKLLHLDEGRLLQVREGLRGTFTVWKHNGHQIQLRENGVPTGVATTDAGIFPHYAAEVLPAALPLILHEAPLHVMVLGLGSGEPLRATLGFPIQGVVCVEPDRQLIQLVQEIPFEAVGESGRIVELEPVDGENAPLITIDPGPMPPFMLSFLDDRLRFECVDPALAMLGASTNERFDVIVSNPDHSSLARSAPYFSQQFYQRVASRLSSAGIFSQRLQMLDYGPEPLRSLVATMQTVFRDVAVLEVAPGELTLLATNDERGLLRPQLIDRLAAPQVRALLALVGVDWSSLLSFGGYSHESLAQFVADSRCEMNTISNSRLTFSLPREVMRWGPKLNELQTSLEGQGSSLAMWLGDAEDLTEAFQRQREVAEQIELMGTYADQYWAYRGKVKELITKQPQTGIQQVKHELAGHKVPPDAARRLKYFEALGQAAQTKDQADIDRVAEFESPYDPLISYFLHQEVAELLSRSASRDPARELRHRWHALYFSSANDRSVRSVCDAIGLLLDQPDAEPNSLQRRDDLDALLQLLATRWQLRVGTQPKSTQTMLQDIDLSLKVTDRTCDALAALTVECGLPSEGWSSRRAVLQQLLVRPLRDYREKLLPIHQQNVARLRALQSSK